MYKIKALDTEKNTIPLKASMKQGVIPRFPSSICISGRSGSGKTQLLLNMLTNSKLFGNYFHIIAVFSPTAGNTDDTYKNLNIPRENFIPNFGKEELEELIQSRKNLIKQKGIEWVAKHSRVCIILDDVIANRDFLQSSTALKLFALLRHYLCQIFVLIQSYTKLPRALRLNCNATYIFPATRSEIEVLLDELTPPNLTKKQFEQVIHYTTREPYNFMSINFHAPKGQQIRKNLDEVVDLENFFVS